ncbi:uncharacterized protein [Amphiura filiformis]|uniref:uncharacterized protein n=1 Tax=Amphiura filiformis TaxID=82378 RepID=UPI003B2169BF
MVELNSVKVDSKNSFFDSMAAIKGGQKLSYYIRFIMIGDSGTGKTTLLLRYIHEDTEGEFRLSDKPVHTVDSKSKMIFRQGKNIRVEIQDTAGMERYRSLTKSHYNNAMGALLVFDLTDEGSFQNLPNWHDDLRRYADSDIQTILVGTRCHRKEHRTVPEESVRRYAEHIEAPYIEVSGERNINVDKCFDMLIDRIFEKQPDVVKEEVSLNHQDEDKDTYTRLCAPCCSS